jgi:hypothetical protein
MQEARVDPSAERVARNDAMFRDANERIERRAAEAEVDRVPFICECADASCTQIVRLTIREYEDIRRDPTHFVNVPGHEATGGPHVRVVGTGDGFVVVEKLGAVAEIVERLDPRGAHRDE